MPLPAGPPRAYCRLVRFSAWRRRRRLDREFPPLVAPNGTYALHLTTDAGTPVAELHLRALDWVGFEVFLLTEGLSQVVEYGHSVRLRCPVGSGSLHVAWEPLGLMVTRSDAGLAEPQLLAEDGSKLRW